MTKLQRYFMIAGVFCGLYCIGVLIIIGTNHWFNFFGLIACAFFQCLALLFPYIKRLPAFIKIFVLSFIVFCMATVLFFEGLIIWEGQNEPKQNSAYVIILGAKVNGREPSLVLSRRIASAAEYMMDNPRSIAVATGGLGVDEGIAEGDAIAQGLLDLGIAADRILKETTSTSTRENLLYALQIIKDYGGTAAEPVVIVSSAFHLYRAQRLALAIGYKEVSGQGSASMLYLVPHYYLREFVALIKEEMDGNI